LILVTTKQEPLWLPIHQYHMKINSRETMTSVYILSEDDEGHGCVLQSC